MIALLDDLVIHSSYLASHIELQRNVLSIFHQNQFNPTLTKCNFARTELTSLGHTLCAGGFRPAETHFSATGCFTVEFLVSPILYELSVSIDWLVKHNVV